MNECMEDVDYWQKRSERYHDILVSIDYKIQQFGEEYIGPKDCNIGNLREGLSAHLPDVSKLLYPKNCRQEWNSKTLHIISGP